MMSRIPIDALVRPMVRNLKPYASARDEYSGPDGGMVFLDANENPNDNGLNRYPDPHSRQVREAMGRFRGVTPDRILLGNGSDEIIDLLFRAFCEPGRDSVVTLPPSYGMYAVLAGINQVRNLEIPLGPGFQPESEAILEQAGAQTKLLFLCTPNNPSGNRFEPARVEALLDGFPGLVVIDEAYVDFTPDSGWLPRLSEYPNLVVTQTFSKALGMAGIRLGVCFADPGIIAYLNRIKPPYNVNSLTQERALAALADPKGIRDQVRVILAERNRMETELAGIPFIRHVFPSDANFLLVRVDDAARRYAQLIGKGVVVRNRSGQLNCENTLRLTIGTPAENNHLLAVMREMEA